MKNAAITIEGLSKSYQRGRIRKPDLRSSISSLWFKSNLVNEDFFALQDIDLVIEQGDVVGIVGPNGAGKSTLLKLLSRITFPTKGRMMIRGTLSSMLEVGTGFHPELTGRENVYLNGAIIGMSREEVNHKLESIVAFSGLEDFLDMPVKHYSSGMYVRLAFSVSSHLETDILLIDEVLAVGDLEFKRKCLEWLTDISRQGRTILMVSHQLSYLKSFCSKGIYLAQGRIKSKGMFEEVVNNYLLDNSLQGQSGISSRQDRGGDGKCKVMEISIADQEGQVSPVICSGQNIFIQVKISSLEKRLRQMEIRLECFDFMGRQWFVLNNTVSNDVIRECDGNLVAVCNIFKLPLNEGNYYFDVSVFLNQNLADEVRHAFEFVVEKGMFYTTGRLPHPAKGMLIDYQWKVKDTA